MRRIRPKSGDRPLEHEDAPGEMALATAVHPVLQSSLHALDVVLADTAFPQFVGVFDKRLAHPCIVARQLVRAIVEFDFQHAQFTEGFAVERGDASETRWSRSLIGWSWSVGASSACIGSVNTRRPPGLSTRVASAQTLARSPE